MYLSKAERQEIMTSYGYKNSTEINHYEVGPDTWIYLFEFEDKKYILIAADYLGDYEFEVFDLRCFACLMCYILSDKARR